jgi:Protein of unknown function (DUF2721)
VATAGDSQRRNRISRQLPAPYCDDKPNPDPMLTDTPTISQLSHVISQAAAPAFLLGALAAFIAVLINRLNRIIDRTIVLNAIADDDAARSRLKVDLPRLMRRAAMLNRAIFWAVIASILGNRSGDRRICECSLTDSA